MTKKKKRRKRPAPLRQPDTKPATPAKRGAARSGGKGSAGTADRSRRSRVAQDRKAIVAEWAHPPVAVSVARGLRTVGTSPLLVVSSFLAALVLWLIFAAYGAAPAPSAMVLMTSLAPVHTLLIDIGAVLTGGGSPAGATLIFLGGLLLLRAGLLSLWIATCLERFGARDLPGPGGGLDGQDGPDPGRGDPSAGAVGARGEWSRVWPKAVRAFGSVLGIEAGFYVLSMATAFLAVGFAIGQLAVIGGLIGGLLFFVFAPIAAVTDGVGPAVAFRLSVKAARLPGPRHMMATVAYIAMTLIVSLFAPTSRVAAATPAITTWLFVLFVTFLHLTALATFTYRWLAVRDRVIAGASSEPGEKPKRPAPAALR